MRHLEEGSRSAARQLQGFPGPYRRCPRDNLCDPGRGVDRYLAFAEEGSDAGGVVSVAVGQEHARDIGEVPPDPG